LLEQHLSDEDRIRSCRFLSNAAIAEKDVNVIASFWTDQIHVLGSMSLQLSGIEANRRFYVDQFASRPDTTYVRTPTTVTVMQSWGTGMESGEWVAAWTDPDGPVRVTGRYMAQWLRVDNEWRIQGELYVPTSCVGGAYCTRHPVKG
jgi:ketosteroid isomerase-like protein